MHQHLLYKTFLTFIFTAGYSIFSFCQQVSCPLNVGFEDGTFSNWQCFSGSVSQPGAVNVSVISPLSNVHTIYDNRATQAVDPYGKFPVNCPNGSRYSIKLGNDQNGAQAERVSYTFTIPVNENDYSIIYNYAVVFQNPNHSEFQQPRFTSKIFDVTSNQYVNCGSFEFVASSSLLGFSQSGMGQNVFYKPWSPITINLNGYAGKTIRLEFTNNDCTLGGHFGYAYLDVNENCSTPITGNIYCNGSDSIRLKAPFGFQEYHWFNSTFTQELGTANTLLITPPPPPNTRYALEIIPYPNLGCRDTLYTTVNLSPDAFNFNVVSTLEACAFSAVNLTDPFVTAGSSPGLMFNYFIDNTEANYISNPTAVNTAGTYFIKGFNSAGCNATKPLNVVIKSPPKLVITSPPQACFPAKADLTAASVTTGSDPDLSFSYWKDSTATQSLLNPNQVGANGTYYIKGASPLGCFNIKPVQVSLADLVLTNQSACGKVDLTNPAVTSGSTALLTYSYWKDSLATVSLSNPDSVAISGDYYIRAGITGGCTITKMVRATVNPIPVLAITDPAEVRYPATVNIMRSFAPLSNASYSYWQNPQATASLATPAAVGESGQYYIKGTSAAGCTIVKPVVVVVNPPLMPKIIAPTAFSPNDDGINDVFRPAIDGEVMLYHLRIYDRWGQEMFDTPDVTRYWNGNFKGKRLPVGTYYWVFEGTDTYRKSKVSQSGAITLLR